MMKKTGLTAGLGNGEGRDKEHNRTRKERRNQEHNKTNEDYRDVEGSRSTQQEHSAAQSVQLSRAATEIIYPICGTALARQDSQDPD